MKILVLIASLLLTGCYTTYNVSRCHDEVCATATIKTRREFPEGLQIKYNRETGDFELVTGSVKTQSVDSVLAEGLLKLVDKLPGK